jgi:hypothetical protein
MPTAVVTVAAVAALTGFQYAEPPPPEGLGALEAGAFALVEAPVLTAFQVPTSLIP